MSAFATVAAPAGITFGAGPFGAAGGALVLSRGSYLAALGVSAPSTLPTGGGEWSVSAWLKCDPGLFSSALEWGAPGDAQAVALGVSGAQAVPSTVSTLAGGIVAGFADGVGASASFALPSSVAMIPYNGVVDVASITACASAWLHVALTYSPLSLPLSLSAFVDGELS